ncbi:MAG: PD40 domain-containing protein [Verrucomicrobia bacterium]|nr:PD40 domain-containing protein [Verrucomicrobiota bacterium]
MKKLMHQSAIIALAALLIAFPAAAAESLSVLLQKGIYAEETEGNLDAAIKIYEGIVREADANRSLVAQAQYRLGVCQLKKGKKEDAEAAFRSVLDRFPAETELVTKTRERLSELGSAAGPVVIRQIWSPKSPADLDGSITSDGRYLSFTDWETGDLAIRDLNEGQNRRLTDKGPLAKSTIFVETSVFSADGKQVAYNWYPDRNQTGIQLRIIALDDPKPRVLLTNSWVRPEAWSGDSIAVVTDIRRKECALQLVSASSGAIRKLQSLPSLQPDRLCFSPDGQYLAYSCSSERSRASDVFLIDVKTSAADAVMEHAANDTLLGWTPDGRGLLISSDHRGSTDLWFLPISAGKGAGELVLLKADLGQISPVGVSRSGAFYYAVSARASDVAVVSMDFSTGKILSGPKEIPCRFNGLIKTRFSADGKFMAFDHGPEGKEKFYVHDLASGQAREYPTYPKLLQRINIVFSADNRKLLIQGYTLDFRSGLFVLDRTTGETNHIAVSEPNDGTLYGAYAFHDGAVRFVQWEPQTSRLAFVRHNLSSGEKQAHVSKNLPDSLTAGKFLPTAAELSRDEKQLFHSGRVQTESGSTEWRAARRDLATGKELELYRGTGPIVLRKGPDADDVVAILVSSRPTVAATAIVIDVAETSAKERFRAEIPGGAANFWNGPSGKPLFLIIKNVENGSNVTTELWTLSAATGELNKTDFAMANLVMPNVNVRLVGQNQIFFQKGGPQIKGIWVMENFLPPVASAK